MQPRVLDWLECPLCQGTFQARNAPSSDGAPAPAQIACKQGHAYPVINGVPCLRSTDRLTDPDRVDSSRAISDSFSSEWSLFDYESSRTWHSTVDERCELFLREMDVSPDDLQAKVLLDAGCGNGTLSEGIARLGCEVIAMDASSSVFAAEAYFSQKGCGRTHFVRGSLLELPLQSQSADFIYSSGVLHHNPDTLAALKSILRALKPGGKIYIWLYHLEPELKFRLQLALRSLLAPLPIALKRNFVYLWSAQSMLRQHIRTALHLNGPDDRLTWKERVVDLMDIYTPRYRWMHTQDEVHRWYKELGLIDIKTTEVRRWGFGVVGTAPR